MMTVVELGGILYGQDQLIAALFDPMHCRLPLGRWNGLGLEIFLAQ